MEGRRSYLLDQEEIIVEGDIEEDHLNEHFYGGDTGIYSDIGILWNKGIIPQTHFYIGRASKIKWFKNCPSQTVKLRTPNVITHLLGLKGDDESSINLYATLSLQQQQPSGQRQEQQEDNQEQNMMRQPLEGALSKYTNVMKGWQYRWFVLSPDSGMLEYYMMEDREFKKQRPRGAVFLAGAVISPSDEDGQTFSLSPACGEAYKLRAADAKERQYWVTRLRAVAEHHTGTLTNQHHPSNQEPHPTFLPGSLSESLGPVRKMLLEAERCHLNLAQTISVSPASHRPSAILLLNVFLQELPSEGNKNAKCIDNKKIFKTAGVAGSANDESHLLRSTTVPRPLLLSATGLPDPLRPHAGNVSSRRDHPVGRWISESSPTFNGPGSAGFPSTPGQEKVNDDQHPGRPRSLRCEENKLKIKELIKSNRRISIKDLSSETGLSVGLCHQIVTKDLDMIRTSSKFFPRILTEEQKEMDAKIIPGDETWLYQYDPETKRQSSQWIERGEPKPKKARFTNSKVKTLLVTFFYINGLVHQEFIPFGRTINQEVYLGIMRRLREAVHLKRPERWQNNDLILHVDNARPHTAHVVLQFLAKHSTIQIPHPPYSPDLAPNDFFLYPELKMKLKGRKFDNVDMIQAESKATLRNLSKGDFISCFDNWKKRWNSQEPLLKSISKSVNQLPANSSVTVQWLPAHVGIPGNELADSLAKAGALGLPEARKSTTQLNERDLLRTIKTQCLQVFPLCTKCNSQPATPKHIIDCIDSSIDELYSSPADTIKSLKLYKLDTLI
ncbi:hypothetical protein LAZ67_3003045 [Cordylochernes scorpioides]|uniref:PH domain-containing protein n=1 Tax=Cordylochernes scorpioides TaxID=51811 RepID=A0ABY6KBE9_9ARAC|nr:hypothetical protein LAZ67_3003045 [Cordylochernes scorpioides]